MGKSKENWKPYFNYEVSDLGNVRNAVTKRTMSVYRSSSGTGYYMSDLSLTKAKVTKFFNVDRKTIAAIHYKLTWSHLDEK
jgi:hypothetical protein